MTGKSNGASSFSYVTAGNVKRYLNPLVTWTRMKQRDASIAGLNHNCKTMQSVLSRSMPAN